MCFTSYCQFVQIYVLNEVSDEPDGNGPAAQLTLHPISKCVNFDTDITGLISDKQFGELGPWNQN